MRAPNASHARVVQRACAVLKSLEPRRADCDALDLFTTGALQRKAFDASEGVAPHVARQLLSARVKPADARTAAIHTTLRAPLQRFAVQTLQQHLRELQGRHVEDGALVVLDNASGEVLAWVGSSGALSNAAEVDFVTALRQPGSTLKPFLYAQAIAERRITAASLLEDSGAQIQTAGGLYEQSQVCEVNIWPSSVIVVATPHSRALFCLRSTALIRLRMNPSSNAAFLLCASRATVCKV